MGPATPPGEPDGLLHAPEDRHPARPAEGLAPRMERARMEAAGERPAPADVSLALDERPGRSTELPAARRSGGESPRPIVPAPPSGIAPRDLVDWLLGLEAHDLGRIPAEELDRYVVLTLSALDGESESDEFLTLLNARILEGAQR